MSKSPQSTNINNLLTFTIFAYIIGFDCIISCKSIVAPLAFKLRKNFCHECQGSFLTLYILKYILRITHGWL